MSRDHKVEELSSIGETAYLFMPDDASKGVSLKFAKGGHLVTLSSAGSVTPSQIEDAARIVAGRL